jgi:hypothetical protein
MEHHMHEWNTLSCFAHITPMFWILDLEQDGTTGIVDRQSGIKVWRRKLSVPEEAVGCVHLAFCEPTITSYLLCLSSGCVDCRDPDNELPNIVTLHHCHDDNVIEAAIEMLNDITVIGSDVFENGVIDQDMYYEL